MNFNDLLSKVNVFLNENNTKPPQLANTQDIIKELTFFKYNLSPKNWLLEEKKECQKIKEECQKFIDEAINIRFDNDKTTVNDIKLIVKEKENQINNITNEIENIIMLQDELIDFGEFNLGVDDVDGTCEETDEQLHNLETQRDNLINEVIDIQTNGCPNQVISSNDFVDNKHPLTSISQITISPLSEPKFGTVGLASISLYDTVTINSIQIKQKTDKSGLYIKMPQKRTVDGKFVDVAHPIVKDVRAELNDKIIDMYNSGNVKFINKDFNNTSPKIMPQKIHNFKNSERTLARLDVVVGDFVFHNAKIIKTNDNNTVLSLPTYKGADGNYHSIVVPKNAEAFKKLNDTAVAEFNTDYKFKRVSADELKTLKDNDISFSSGKTENGQTLIKFTANNEQAISKALDTVAQVQQQKNISR